MSEAVNRRSAWLFFLALLLLGCEELGNPEQHATGPTPWNDSYGHLITTTRSFTDDHTIRRVAAQLDDLDYADPSIGPSQSLTIVVVVPRAVRRARRGKVRLVTIFKLENRPPIERRWAAPLSSRKWSAAFALPEPPAGAVTSVVP